MKYDHMSDEEASTYLIIDRFVDNMLLNKDAARSFCTNIMLSNPKTEGILLMAKVNELIKEKVGNK